ncbi:hypothetical protein BASA81_003869 [Batrachochytrium salamandrivorans]|nr:hypothetical protein BASA81_003869 [Batrachochytrium salamandrivorans]
MLGASLASRNDQVGARTRALSLGTAEFCEAKSAQFKQEHQEAAQKAQRVLDVLFEVNSKLHLSAALVQVSVAVAEKSETARLKVEDELDRRGYLEQAQQVCSKADQFTGFSRALLAIKHEL